MKKVHDNIKAKVQYIERQGKYSKGAKSEELRESWSEDLPSWAINSFDFWHDIETEEKPGQVQARGIELALPVELSKEEQRAIVEEFSDTVLKNHARTIAIHDSLDGKNPHVHIYFTERLKNDKEEPPRGKYCRQRTGYSKDRIITGGKGKEWLLKIRKDWENIQNQALEKAGIPWEQVSCESLEAQGIAREAQIHVGYQDTNRYRKTGEKGARYRRNEAILSRNRDYVTELSAASAEVDRLEKAVKEERKAKEEAARKAAEAAKKAEEVAQKAAVERRRLEAEAARRRADAEVKAKAEEEAQKAAEHAAAAAQREPEPEPKEPERWLSDDTMWQIAGTWFNAKHYDHDAAAIKTVISRIMPGKFDFSQINEKDQERLCEAALAVLGQIRRSARIKTKEAGKRAFSEILGAARVPEREAERSPEQTPERSPELEPRKEPKITKSKLKDQNRGWER